MAWLKSYYRMKMIEAVCIGRLSILKKCDLSDLNLNDLLQVLFL